MIVLPKAILFDWDNTLVSNWQVIGDGFNYMLVQMGHEPWSAERLRKDLKYSPRDTGPQIFGDQWEVARTHFYDHIKSRHLDELELLPGTRALLEHLANLNIYLGVVSNKTGEYLRKEADHLGLAPFFTRIIGSGDATQDKPHPAPVHLALEGSNITPSKQDVWFVGDMDVDLLCAERSECRSILFGHEMNNPDHVPDHHFDDAHGMLDFLYRLQK